MKRFILSFLIALVSISARAQTDNAAPTKEDALNFLNQVARLRTDLKREDDGWYDFWKGGTFTLDGCKLIYTSSYFSLDRVQGAYTYFRDSSAIVIDLSNVKCIGDTIVSLSPNAILELDRKLGSKVTYKRYKGDYTSDVAEFNKRYDWENIKPEVNTLDFLSGPSVGRNSGGLYSRLGVPPSLDMANNYSKRFYKAVSFLIKSCGGGHVKNSENSKF